MRQIVSVSVFVIRPVQAFKQAFKSSTLCGCANGIYATPLNTHAIIAPISLNTDKCNKSVADFVNDSGGAQVFL